MFWCRATLHSPLLPAFLNSASTDSLKPSEGLPTAFFTQRGFVLQGNKEVEESALRMAGSELAKCL